MLPKRSPIPSTSLAQTGNHALPLRDLPERLPELWLTRWSRGQTEHILYPSLQIASVNDVVMPPRWTTSLLAFWRRLMGIHRIAPLLGILAPVSEYTSHTALRS